MPDTLTPLPRTERALTIGAVGHRNLGSEREAIAEQIDRTLRMVIAENPNTCLSLVCSVAEGADRLLLAAAASLKIRYDCVLPCSPDCFREDFHSEESKAEFDRFLIDARSIEQPSFPIEKESGYLWASEYVLDRADTLIAVWDGAPGSGPAGTAESVASALRRGIPVIWISSEPPNISRILEPGAATFS